ncbi:acetaldehyde dehydrogenase (acetylating) [Sporosarcina sp. FSL K6-3457]|uniref:acetaldehyde dehydrogenase (acetylating) n=1 Tax=Sporosarcina sp. FSL K6-3457 TaxID=2978204 RepID=UPI0030FB0D94
MSKVNVAIIGSGNIGTDLMYKLERSELLNLTAVIGIDPQSDGLKRAQERGYHTFSSGIDAIRNNPDLAEIVFDATSAKAHLINAEVLKELNKIAIDLTPAAVGPLVSPAVNGDTYHTASNINMITCGGQATIPMIHAVNRVADVTYAEIVATISSKSAGPGTRANIDEFTITTQRGIEEVGGADKGKALILINPAEPPVLMRDTVYCQVKNMDIEAITKSVNEMLQVVQSYVPGYRLKQELLFDEDKVTILLEVEGAGDYFPVYAGNLDIMTAAAVKVAEERARRILRETGGVTE